MLVNVMHGIVGRAAHAWLIEELHLLVSSDGIGTDAFGCMEIILGPNLAVSISFVVVTTILVISKGVAHCERTYNPY